MRLNGGEFLLNLLVLGTLTISSESVTITDESVIKQLTDLKNYINNQKSIKPLFVKFNNGTEIVVAKGEVRKFIDNTDFILYARTKTSSIEINVSFTQMVNANEDPIDDYYIADGDATLTFTNEVQIFENIVDKDGHKRFIEGDIELSPGYESSINKTYGKYSLSGSHLLIVLAGNFIAEQTASGGVCATLTLPKWIFDKISATFASYIYITSFGVRGDDTAPLGNASVALIKGENNQLYIGFTSPVTVNTKGNFRFNFDLLIDNESSENAGE